MTTAARPTYEPARGGTSKGENDLSSLSKQYSSRDLPAHTKLKYRQEGQGLPAEIKNRDFRKDLEERERSSKNKRDRVRESESTSSVSSGGKRPRVEQLPTANLDADDPLEDDDDDDDEEADSGDDEAELLAELQKIKKERAAEMARKDAERKVEEERIRMDNIIKGNPLLQIADRPGDFSVKRRWDDDVVFKNCARGESDKKNKHFINDTLRSEFHKKFMEKYIK